MAKRQLYLIDGHALAYRMFYALPVENFSTKSGEPTNATHGFTSKLFDILLDNDPPQYLAVSFDLGRTFRDDMFEEYKATREKMPDELSVQIERIKELVQAFNIPVFEKEGFEADDVLGTLAAIAKDEQVPVHILTGDRDLLQLVDENTTVELPGHRWHPAPQVFSDAAGVTEKMNVPPHQIVDYKALMGDSSDNIPGVRGVGEKTATKLLQKYATLDEIYENLEDVSGRFRKKLAASKEEAYLSRKLARIVRDVPIEFELEACRARDFEPSRVLDIFHELEFRSHTDTLYEAVNNGRLGRVEDGDIALRPESQPPTETVVIRTADALQELIANLQTVAQFTFDLETTGLDKQQAEIVGIAIAYEPPTGYYIPVGHLADAAQAESGQLNLFAGDHSLAEGQLALDTVLDALQPVLTDPDIDKIAHNAKFDYAILGRYGVEVSPITFDTMIAEWLTDPNTKHKGLKNLAEHRLQIRMKPIEDLIGKGRKQITFAEVDIDEAAPYAAADADVTLRLIKPLRHEIKQLNLDKVLDIELPLIPILAAMESEGVGIDREFFDKMSQELTDRLRELEGKIHEIAGEEFNINSPQQLSEILFDKLDLHKEGVRKTSSGYYSTAASVLESVREHDDTGVIDKVLEFRELGKLKGTYVDALPELVDPDTGRIHTSFNQTGTVTGRIASSNPNLQNIPIRTEIGRRIRRGFVPRPGWVFLAADYSQVELRILAHLSQDEAMLEAFRQDQDIHRTTAAAVYGIADDEVDYDQRRFAKAVNFGLMYGMGAYRLARDSEMTLGEARDFIETYFNRFPGVRDYLDGTKEKAREQGYVETLFGRRRYFTEFEHGGHNAKRRAEREAINHPVQGSAADIIKVAMIRLQKELLAHYEARMILQVHDELVLELPEEEADEIRPLVVETMRGAYDLDVPLKVDANVGHNWLEIK